MSQAMLRIVLVPLCLVMLLMAGCYETAFVLGRAEDANVDATLLGQWSFDSLGEAANERALLSVSDLDRHRYAMEWKTLADGKSIKYVGFVAQVKGVLFVHVTPLDAEGKPAKTHYLLRLDRDGSDVIVLSNIDPEFLVTRKVDSDATLRAAIEANLDNAALYMPDVLLGNRVKAN